jgi:phage regulator Rha-like protein
MAKKEIQVLIIEQKILSKIFILRGENVMLDRDLAELYGVEPRRLREQVKRNIERFPSKFMFQLKGKEVDSMVSQNAIPSKQYLGGALPYAFTEHGVLMLANVLKSKQALDVSIRVIEIFVKMREYALTHKEILLQLSRMEKEVKGNSKDIENIFMVLKELIEKQSKPLPSRNKIGFRRNDEID